MDLFCRELMKDWHSDGSVGEHGKKGARPCRTVASAESNLVTALDARTFKHDMELLYLTRDIMVLQRGAFKVGQCVPVPITNDTLFD